MDQIVLFAAAANRSFAKTVVHFVFPTKIRRPMLSASQAVRYSHHIRKRPLSKAIAVRLQDRRYTGGPYGIQLFRQAAPPVFCHLLRLLMELPLWLAHRTSSYGVTRILPIVPVLSCFSHEIIHEKKPIMLRFSFWTLKAVIVFSFSEVIAKKSWNEESSSSRKRPSHIKYTLSLFRANVIVMFPNQQTKVIRRFPFL